MYLPSPPYSVNIGLPDVIDKVRGGDFFMAEDLKKFIVVSEGKARKSPGVTLRCSADIFVTSLSTSDTSGCGSDKSIPFKMFNCARPENKNFNLDCKI
jgi:hypothetical protein